MKNKWQQYGLCAHSSTTFESLLVTNEIAGKFGEVLFFCRM